MSLEYIYFEGRQIVFLNLEGVTEAAAKIDHVKNLNLLVAISPNADILVLVNLKGFMPGKDFMEYATETLKERAGKIDRAAYIGLDGRNKKLYDFYDRFNANTIERGYFEDRESALAWLVSPPPSER